MEEGETKTLTYRTRISSAQNDGLYRDLAHARGTTGNGVTILASDPANPHPSVDPTNPTGDSFIYCEFLAGVFLSTKCFSCIVVQIGLDFKEPGRCLGQTVQLHHCLGQGSYADKIASKQIIVAFIRRKRSRNVPFVTVSVDRKSGDAVQCYGKNNSKPEKRVLDFVNGPFTKAAKRIAKAI
jgi:hypothetical protein